MRDDFFADDSCSGRFLFGTIFCLGRIFVRADSVVWDDLFGTTCQGEFLLRNDLNGRMIHRSECSGQFICRDGACWERLFGMISRDNWFIEIIYSDDWLLSGKSIINSCDDFPLTIIRDFCSGLLIHREYFSGRLFGKIRSERLFGMTHTGQLLGDDFSGRLFRMIARDDYSGRLLVILYAGGGEAEEQPVGGAAGSER